MIYYFFCDGFFLANFFFTVFFLGVFDSIILTASSFVIASIFVVFGSNLLSLQRGEILRFNYMHHRSRNFTQEESVKGGKVRKLLRMKFCFFSI
mgnify:CR=1 FL=1